MRQWHASEWTYVDVSLLLRKLKKTEKPIRKWKWQGTWKLHCAHLARHQWLVLQELGYLNSARIKGPCPTIRTWQHTGKTSATRAIYLVAYYCSSISILFCSYSRAISNKKVLPYCAQLFRTSRENIRKRNGQNFGGIWLYPTSSRSFLQLFTSERTSMHIRLSECTCDFVCSDQTNWKETNKLSARSRSPLNYHVHRYHHHYHHHHHHHHHHDHQQLINYLKKQAVKLAWVGTIYAYYGNCSVNCSVQTIFHDIGVPFKRLSFEIRYSS